MKTTTYRDLTILPISTDHYLVIACDSSAGIGEKKEDLVTIDPAVTAAFCLRVPLLELLCFGAVPICIIDLIGNELVPTGERMLEGIKKETVRAGISDLPINGSTEENIPTKTSSIGITVLGEIKGKVKLPNISEECSLLQLGQPYVGDDVVKNREKIFSYDLVKALRNEPGVVDMLPVGSKGIRFEAGLMAEDSNYQVVFETENDLDCSAGPATVILLAIAKNHETAILEDYPMLKKIGEFKRS